MAKYESLVALKVEINAQGKFDFKVEYTTNDLEPWTEEYEVESYNLRKAFLEIIEDIT